MDSQKEGIHLVYQYFHVKASNGIDAAQTAERQAEYQDCLLRNILHPHVARVHILIENERDQHEFDVAISKLSSNLRLGKKVVSVWLGRRMTYKDAFLYCNNQLMDKIAVVMNADIFMGTGIEKLLKHREQIFNLDKSSSCKVVLSLTRHEPSLCKHFPRRSDMVDFPISQQEAKEWCGCPFLKGRRYYGSHDSFWFIPPLSDSVLDECNHVQNRWGAEHKVLISLIRKGYQVFNPCVSLVTYHHHATDIHPWRNESGGNQVLADPRDHKPLPPKDLIDLMGRDPPIEKPSTMIDEAALPSEEEETDPHRVAM